MPVGRDAENDGVPIGFMVLGDHWNEHKVLRIARAVEEDHEGVLGRPLSRGCCRREGCASNIWTWLLSGRRRLRKAGWRRYLCVWGRGRDKEEEVS